MRGGTNLREISRTALLRVQTLGFEQIAAKRRTVDLGHLGLVSAFDLLSCEGRIKTQTRRRQ